MGFVNCQRIAQPAGTRGGWSFAIEPQFPNESRIPNPLYTAEVANTMMNNPIECLTFKTEPVFSATETMLNPSADLIERTQERYEILAYRIPALSPAMGRSMSFKGNTIPNFSFRPLNVSDEWPRRVGAYSGQWLHSDIKNMSFLHSSVYFQQFQILLSPASK